MLINGVAVFFRTCLNETDDRERYTVIVIKLVHVFVAIIYNGLSGGVVDTLEEWTGDGIALSRILY